MSYNILILEDDAGLRQALQITLEDEDYDVHVAASGREALQLARSHRFDVAVSDVRMEGPDGLEVLNTLKAQNPPLQCIVMTGFAGDEAPARAMKIQVDDYLYKPFKARDLLASVRRLERRQSDAAQLDGLCSRALSGYCRIQGHLANLTQEQRTHLFEARQAAFRSFYVGVRSGKLDLQEGILAWDLLEQGEVRWEEVLELESPTTEDCRGLYHGYRALAQRMSEARLPARPRDPEQVSPQSFAPFHQRVLDGELSLEELKMAPMLRRADPVALATDEALRFLRERIWGPANQET